MKKIFFLACAAVLFAACSSETTEDVMFNSKVVSATVDTRSTAAGCDKRGTACEFLGSPEFRAGQTEHFHCVDPQCEYYNGYFANERDAYNHCKSNQGHHGGKGSFE